MSLRSFMQNLRAQGATSCTRKLRLWAHAAVLLGTLGALPQVHALTAQTITGFAPASPVPYSYYGSFTLTATGGGSGNPVTFGSSTPSVCSVAGNAASILSAGTCLVTADQAGNATYSAAPQVTATVVINPASQTITFSALANQTYPGYSAYLSATASSGLAVTFSSTTPSVCSVSGTWASILTAGTCTVAANQAGNGTYSAAPSATQSFTIGQATQYITFAGLAGKTYGAAPFTVTATASSGLAVNFSSTTPAVCTVAGNTVTIGAAGTCTIAANQAGSANYQAAAQVANTFIVSKATQTISFAGLATQALNASPIPVTATATSGLPVAFSSISPTVCTVAGNLVTLITTGTCSIAANQAGDGNYLAAAQVLRSFTVTKGSQTISFAPIAAHPLGDAPFTVSATASSGLAVTFSSSTGTVCSVSGATVTLLQVGTCTLAANQAGNANYLAAPTVTQSFAITGTLLPQAITAFNPATPIPYSPGGRFTLSATGGGSGNAVTFGSTTSSVCTVSGNTATVISAGTCILSANQAGNAAYAAAPQVLTSVVITPMAQTINFGAIPNQRLGADPFVVSASASSGLLVAISTTTPTICSLDASHTVTLLALGTCTLAADQAGNGNLQAAPTVTQSFPVGQAGIRLGVGRSHACALTNAGGIQCWGANGSGQLGSGTATDSSVPVDVTGLTSGVAAVESGTAHSCAITQEGAVQCWGANESGQLGDGTLQASATPRPVQGLTSGVIALTLGARHTCALQGGGNLVCWGGNESGQLGNGTTTDSLTPVAVTGLGSAAVDVRAGDAHTCAVTQAGAILCWGQNTDGQIGDGSTTMAASPVTVAGLTSGIWAVEGAARHSCALSTAGGIKCWGANGQGQLGTGNASSSLTPVDVAGLSSGIGAIAAGGNASCALNNGGAESCWGELTQSATAQAMAGLSSGIQEIGVGGTYACALTDHGAVLCWGTNAHGQLGDGGTIARSTPAPVTGLTGGTATNQSIAFPPIGNKTMADSPIALTAVASSGLAVSFSSITPTVCSVANASVTLQSAGGCTISAHQNGNGSVNAAQTVTQSFTITLASQTITGFSPATPLIYSANLTFALSASGGNSGNPITYGTTTPSICTVAGATVTVLKAGTCTVTADQAGNTTYSAASQATATVVISPVSQSISFAALSAKTMGEAPFALTATASSGLAVTFSAQTNTVCTVTNGMVSLITVGTCTIAADQAGDGNTSPAPTVMQSFTVAPGNQVITGFTPASPITYSANGTFALAASGGASGNPVTFSSTPASVCTVSGTIVTIQAAGTCTLTADQAGNANYQAAAQVTATVIIHPASQSITFNPLADGTVGSTQALAASASSGLPVGFSSTTGTICTVAASTVTLIAPGTCTVAADQAGNGNIAAAPQAVQSIQVTVPPAQVYYIHSDQLNTPRVITDGNSQVVWQWDNAEAFGNNAPNENPSNLGTFTFNQRFPGQYYDQETGLHYNYFRDYDPSTGRYVESDPIGLRGGINTYAYTGSDPIGRTDPSGLAWKCVSNGVITTCTNPPAFPADPFWPTPPSPGWSWPSWPGSRPAESRSQGTGAEARPPDVDAGKDCDGRCNPCPPNPPPFTHQGDAHGSTGGFHTHQWQYHQDKNCICRAGKESW